MKDYRSRPNDVEGALELFETYQEFFIEAALNPTKFRESIQGNVLGGLGFILQKISEQTESHFYHNMIAKYKSALVDPKLLEAEQLLLANDTQNDMPKLAIADIVLSDFRQKDKKLPASGLQNVKSLEWILNFRVNIDKKDELPNTEGFKTITLAEYITLNKNNIQAAAKSWYRGQDRKFKFATHNIWENRKHLLTTLKNAESTGTPYLSYDTITKLRAISLKTDPKDYQSQIDEVITKSQQISKATPVFEQFHPLEEKNESKDKSPYGEIPRAKETKDEDIFGGLPETEESTWPTDVPISKAEKGPYDNLPIYESKDDEVKSKTEDSKMPEQTEHDKKLVQDIYNEFLKWTKQLSFEKGHYLISKAIGDVISSLKAESGESVTLTQAKNKIFTLYNQLIHLKESNQISEKIFKPVLTFINDTIVKFVKDEKFNPNDYDTRPLQKTLLERCYNALNNTSKNDISFSQLYQIIELIKQSSKIDQKFLDELRNETQKLVYTSSPDIKSAAKFILNETIMNFRSLDYQNEPVKRMLLERLKNAYSASDPNDRNLLQLTKVFEIIKNMPNLETEESIQKVREALQSLQVNSKAGFFKKPSEINKAAAYGLTQLDIIMPEKTLGPRK